MTSKELKTIKNNLEKQKLTDHKMDGQKFKMHPFSLEDEVYVNDLVYCVTSQSIILASTNNEIQIWKINPENNQFEEYSTLDGHNSMVKALIICRKTNTLFSGSWDGQLIIWKLKENEGDFNYREEDTFETETKGIDSLAYNRNENIIFVGSRDSKIIVFKRNSNIKRYEEQYTIEGGFTYEKGKSNKKIQVFIDIKYSVCSMSFNEKHDLLYVAAEEKCIFIYGRSGGVGVNKYSFISKIELTQKYNSSIMKVLYIPNQDIIASYDLEQHLIFWTNKNRVQGEIDEDDDISDDYERPEYQYFKQYMDHSHKICSMVYSEQLGNLVITGGNDGILNSYKITALEKEEDSSSEDDFDDENFDIIEDDVQVEQNTAKYTIEHKGVVDTIRHQGNVVSMYYCEDSNQLFSVSDSFAVRVRQFKKGNTGVKKLKNQEKIEYDDFEDRLEESYNENMEKQREEEEIERQRLEQEKLDEEERNRMESIELENQRQKEEEEELERRIKRENKRQKEQEERDQKIAEQEEQQRLEKEAREDEKFQEMENQQNQIEAVQNLKGKIILTLDIQQKVTEQLNNMTQQIFKGSQQQKEDSQKIKENLRNQLITIKEKQGSRLNKLEKKLAEKIGQQDSKGFNSSLSTLENNISDQMDVSSFWMKGIREDMNNLKQQSNGQYWQLFKMIEKIQKKQEKQQKETTESLNFLMKNMDMMLAQDLETNENSDMFSFQFE